MPVITNAELSALIKSLAGTSFEGRRDMAIVLQRCGRHDSMKGMKEWERGASSHALEVADGTRLRERDELQS